MSQHYISNEYHTLFFPRVKQPQRERDLSVHESGGNNRLLPGGVVKTAGFLSCSQDGGLTKMSHLHRHNSAGKKKTIKVSALVILTHLFIFKHRTGTSLCQTAWYTYQNVQKCNSYLRSIAITKKKFGGRIVTFSWESHKIRKHTVWAGVLNMLKQVVHINIWHRKHYV